MTIVPFAPSPTSSPPFSAQIVLDNAPYTLVAIWSVYRSDWYVSLIDANGTTVITQPLIGSPADSTIYLASGLFMVSTLAYRSATQSFEVGP